MADTKTTNRPSTSKAATNVWSDEERAAMKESARERKASSRRDPAKEREDGEREVRAKIAELPSPDRELAERLHEIVTTVAPHLVPRTFYGMPAYARDGKTTCFFKPASKFKDRYATLGFETGASLDDGALWPVAFALIEFTPAVERQVAELVKRAAG
jgi:uncharacterized protein YdhG (YjbR/CyaY superfamily)